MLLGYMIFWSTIMMVTLGATRLRHIRQFATMSAVTGLIVFIAYTLANHMAQTAGLDMMFFNPLAYPRLYLESGPLGWMVLMIVPCGWLAPVIGLNAATRWERLSLTV